MALGIPSLVADLQREAAAQKLARHPLRPPRRQQHSEGQGPPSPPPPPTRRSARLQDAAEHPHPKPETGTLHGRRGPGRRMLLVATRSGALPATPPCPFVSPPTHTPPPTSAATCTAEESFDRELGEFAVEGACPRCGRVLERGQRAHLQRCGGEKAALRQPRWRDDEELAELSEEERQDVHKRTLARMKHVQLEGLMDLSPEAARCGRGG